MDKFIINGDKKLYGSIEASGAKNSCLPIMASAILAKEGLSLKNSPNNLSDIQFQAKLLNRLGMDISFGDKKMELKMTKVRSYLAPYDIVRKMRTSILVLGPMLTRFHKITISLPGGCAIGTRPVNIHLDALRKMKADIHFDHGNIIAKTDNGLVGAEIDFEKVSVGATENIMMAACLAKGTTVLSNAAREPEIVDLGHCLIKMGAIIEGLGTQRIVIHGQKSLNKHAEHRIIPDRIEVGSYIFTIAATKGEITILNTRVDDLTKVIEVAREIGVNIEIDGSNIKASCDKKLNPTKISTKEFPGFPTDLQAQLIAAISTANGISIVKENIFENRFMHCPELVRFGANISVNNRVATVIGVDTLFGAEALATDLRASMALIIAALAAKDQSVINRIYHIDRGYENIDIKNIKFTKRI